LSSTISLVGSPGTARSGWLVEGGNSVTSVPWGPRMALSTSAGGIGMDDVLFRISGLFVEKINLTLTETADILE
jgi:hypothetical protein